MDTKCSAWDADETVTHTSELAAGWHYGLEVASRTTTTCLGSETSILACQSYQRSVSATATRGRKRNVLADEEVHDATCTLADHGQEGCHGMGGFLSRDCDLMMVAHGDDFVVAGFGHDLDGPETVINHELEMSRKGRLGEATRRGVGCHEH